MHDLSSVSEILFIDAFGLKTFSFERIVYAGARGNEMLLIDDLGNEILFEKDAASFIEHLPAEKYYRINSECIVCIENVLAFIVSGDQITILSKVQDILKTDIMDQHLFEDFKEWLEYH